MQLLMVEEKQRIERELAQAVAAELSKMQVGSSPGSPHAGKWKAYNRSSVPNNDRWYLEGPDNQIIHFRLSRDDDGKVVLDGVLERNPPVHGHILYAKDNPTIRVSRSRGAAVIAKEIVRRVLPEYRAVFLENRQRIQNENAYIGKTTRNIISLAKAFGVDPLKFKDMRETEEFWAGGTRVQVSGDSVTLEIRSIPVDLAVKIAQLLKDRKQL